MAKERNRVWHLEVERYHYHYRKCTIQICLNLLSILFFLMSGSLQECPPKGWSWQKSLHLSLAIHSLFTCCSPPLPLATLSYVLFYPIHPSSKWPSSPITTLNFSYIHLFSHHTSSSQHGQTTSIYSSSPIPPPNTSLHPHGFLYHTLQVSETVTIFNEGVIKN